MRCPYCHHKESQVKDSRTLDNASVVRRRRVCPQCGGRFTTFEHVQTRELAVVKRDGTRQPFDRTKIFRALHVALRKRDFDEERIDTLVDSIVQELERSGEHSFKSAQIGVIIMSRLRDIDTVAYVRFASVYNDFTDIDDFTKLLSDLNIKHG
jgi:transcriptional repressor NrdR